MQVAERCGRLLVDAVERVIEIVAVKPTLAGASMVDPAIAPGLRVRISR